MVRVDDLLIECSHLPAEVRQHQVRYIAMEQKNFLGEVLAFCICDIISYATEKHAWFYIHYLKVSFSHFGNLWDVHAWGMKAFQVVEGTLWSTSHFVNFNLDNSHLVNIDKVGIDKVRS